MQVVADMEVRAEHIRLVIHREGDVPDTGGQGNGNGRQIFGELRAGRYGHLPRGPRLHMARAAGGYKTLQLWVMLKASEDDCASSHTIYGRMVERLDGEDEHRMSNIECRMTRFNYY